MKKVIFSIFLMSSMILTSCGGGESNEGSDYNETAIGNQIWMTENLNVDKFRNGDPIPYAKSSAQWEKAGKNDQPAWCYYDNDPVKGEKYGKLYNWYAVSDPRGLAPEGWHIPTDAEWTFLTAHLGGEDAAGTKMKSKGGWKDNGNGNDEIGFSGLPGGFCDYWGKCKDLFEEGKWWSSTENDRSFSWARQLYYKDGNVRRGKADKSAGFSVRCIKD
jgi:uncharacterized protein (TIGR02145 family)